MTAGGPDEPSSSSNNNHFIIIVGGGQGKSAGPRRGILNHELRELHEPGKRERRGYDNIKNRPVHDPFMAIYFLCFYFEKTLQIFF